MTKQSDKSTNKPQAKQKHLSPLERLSRKKVKLCFNDGKTMTGVVKWVDKFEIILTIVKDESLIDIVILKHSIKYMYEIDKNQKVEE